MTASKSIFPFKRKLKQTNQLNWDFANKPQESQGEDVTSTATAVAICNQKGGVAKTTTCLSLGACLAELGYSVLLLDLDPQAHLSLSLGFKPEQIRHTSGDALLSNTSLLSVSRESSVPGLDIVPANQQLGLIDKLLHDHKDYEYHLKRRLRTIPSDLYDFVLFDCAPSFGTLTLNALTASDLLVIPIQCEYFAAKSLRSILSLGQMIRKKTNPTLHYQLLITMYDRRNRICRLIRKQMEQNLQSLLFDTIIEMDTKLGESPIYVKPITQYAPQTRGAIQYRALAQELLALTLTNITTNND